MESHLITSLQVTEALRVEDTCPNATWQSKNSKLDHWTSLVAQWIRIHLPKQETQVQSLVQEDSTYRGATKPAYHSYRACPRAAAAGTHMPRADALQQEKPLQ